MKRLVIARRVLFTEKAEGCLSAKRLRHFKCRACGARLYDDDAMHRIQSERAKHTLAHAV